MAKGDNGPYEGPASRQRKDYCDTQRAAYSPDGQDEALGEFGGVKDYKPLNRKGKADTSKQNKGAGGGADYDATEGEATENADTQEGALSAIAGGLSAGPHFASEDKSDLAEDVLNVGKGSEYIFNSDSPFKA